MDPAALAVAITAFLAPYVARTGEKFAEKVGEALPDQVGKLWGAIAAKFKGKPAAEEAAKDLAADPRDEDNQAAFRKELKKLLSEDAGFAQQILPLFQAVQLTHTQSGDVFYGDGAFKVEDNYGTINYENIGTQIKDSTIGGDVGSTKISDSTVGGDVNVTEDDA